nr:hypothetical protein CFP56_77820 [Quercus suber]
MMKARPSLRMDGPFSQCLVLAPQHEGGKDECPLHWPGRPPHGLDEPCGRTFWRDVPASSSVAPCSHGSFS